MAVATNWFDSHSFLFHQPIYNDVFIFSQALACIFGGVARFTRHPRPPPKICFLSLMNKIYSVSISSATVIF